MKKKYSLFTLCVSYSGQCYVSQACFGRSANRGECAQFCRLPFSLVDSDGKVMVKDKHLLSLKDLNQSDELEQLLDAGASSFKIEGRLKDVSYVKNVTATYRQKLDAIFARRQEYVRASSGTCRFDFRPQLDKSFSRGFTHYFLHGRDKEIFSFDTPKSLGEEMGTMKEARGNYLTVAGLKSFNNGDGVCYIDEQGRLQGFRINRVDGNKLYPQEMPQIKPRTRLYRNFDQEFERILSRKSAERKLSVSILLADNNFGFSLTLTDEDDNSVTLSLPREKELARTPQTDHLRTQLAKLGNTPFEAENENLKRNIVNLQKQVQAEQREQTKMENRHSSEINRVDRSYRQKIAEYDNRLELIDTYFPIVKELMPIAEQCREVGFTEELTRRIVSLQPVEFKGRLYSKEYKEKFRTEHSTATVERNPQEKGKFRLCIDGIPILDWFRKKFQEIKEKLGLNTPVENKQRKGLKI